jgi:hypothetical protein
MLPASVFDLLTERCLIAGGRGMSCWKIGLYAVLASGVSISAASAQLNPQQIQIIQDTAASICNTVREAKGQNSDVRVQGDINAQLGGLLGKIAGASAKGSLTKEEFEGLSRDATATAMEGDRGCRERVFNKMFDKLILSDKGPGVGPGVPGWLVRFSAKEAGGGNSTGYGLKTIAVPTTGAIDIRGYFPPGIGGRNVLVNVTATTDQYVAQPGPWVYYVKLNGAPGSYTDCTKFEVDANGILIINAGRHILTGQNLNFDASGTADQSIAAHPLTITLECYILMRKFPVVSLMLKPPSGTWRSPGEREFTTIRHVNPNVPPGEQ